MGRRAKMRQTPASDIPGKNAQLLEVRDGMQAVQSDKPLTSDTFQNVFARTGWGMPNIMEGTQYPLTRLTKNYQLMNSLYRNSWLARRIISTIPEDALKNWFKYNTDLAPAKITKLEKAARLTRLRRHLLEGWRWGRLYGGAIGMMMLEGQEDFLELPLDYDTIMPGDYKGLLIVDRWAGVYPEIELVTDISDPEFGLPKYYQVMDWARHERYRVHHSRVIRFVGFDLPIWEKFAETFWGASVIEPVYEEIKKRDNTSANIAQLIFMANLRIIKMNDLGELLAGSSQKNQQDFYNTIQAQNWLQSNFGIYVMSKDDDFTNITTNFAGLDELYTCFMMDLSGATGIPVTKLFGRSPAGLNATGESDMINYEELLTCEQETHMRPALDKLLPVICLSTLGQIPDDLDYTFNSVRTPTDENVGEIVKYKTEAIFGASDRGMISPKISAMELKEVDPTSDLFSNITDEFINTLDDEVSDPYEEAIAMGLEKDDDPADKKPGQKGKLPPPAKA